MKNQKTETRKLCTLRNSVLFKWIIEYKKEIEFFGATRLYKYIYQHERNNRTNELYLIAKWRIRVDAMHEYNHIMKENENE